MERACGVLLPVFSLPSRYGIGCFSKEAYDFVDFLAAAGCKYWQVLPMGPTGYADSPYQSFSTFAGNPYFIDIESLIGEGLLDQKTVARFDFGKNETRIDYGLLYKNRLNLLRHAYRNYRANISSKALSAREKVLAPSGWLYDFALFMALKEAHAGKPWDSWEGALRLCKKDALKEAKERFADEIGFRIFLQRCFEKQWGALKQYANQKGIFVIGDLPIYVAYDSADVWSSPKLFELDQNRKPVAVAGCPPDDFARTGQLWGNPLYRWEEHKRTGYAWWKKRMRHALTLYDIVRIDHFRGFESYYAINASEETAEHGVWLKGPGHELFEALGKAGTKDRIIAENLGFLTPAVHRLLQKSGYPGMKVLQFAFYPDEEGNFLSEYLPHQYEHNTVVYTGTHDNDTTRMWLRTLQPAEKRFLRHYLHLPAVSKEGAAEEKEITKELIRVSYASVADTVIIPMQDLLLLGKGARINHPSVTNGNWVWRMKRGACTHALEKQMRDMAKTYGR